MSLFLVSFLLSGLLWVVGALTAKKILISNTYSSPFECGFTPNIESIPPITIHFFIVSLIFLIFDVELILLFPFLLSAPVNKILSLTILFSLIFLLSLGLFYEWSNSMLEWLS